MDIQKILIKELDLKPFQVANTIKLIDDGNTIPFIARYRKEQTGELSDVVLRELNERLSYLRSLENRQNEVIRLIDEQGKLTEKLKKDILSAETLQSVEDIYRPYKQKRRTRATIAKEKGLEPLAKILLLQEVDHRSIEDLASPFVDVEKGVESVEDALSGAMDIIAEIVSDNAGFRKIIRRIVYNKGLISVEAQDKEKSSVYEMYYSYTEPVRNIANQNIGN
jgi:uncharacterized protein